MSGYVTCPDCIEYGSVRFSILTAALAVRSQQTGETSQQILDRYMDGVHQRHLSGLPILPGRDA
jgi:hypothetical protein